MFWNIVKKIKASVDRSNAEEWWMASGEGLTKLYLRDCNDDSISKMPREERNFLLDCGRNFVMTGRA